MRTGREYLRLLLTMVREDLRETGRSELRGLGTFAVHQRPARDTFHPKTGEPVHIPERKAIRYRASKELKDLINEPPPSQPQDTVVFPVLDSRIRQFIDRAAKKTGLKEKFDKLGETLSPHTFRHAHATHLYAAGMDPVIIKKLLGHASVEETMGYVACGPVQWREAYDRCHLLG